MVFINFLIPFKLLVYKCNMKEKTIIYLLFSLIFSSLAFGQTNLNRLVPGKDYTYRELLLQRAYTKQLLNSNKEKELDGSGVEYNGNLKIIKEKNKEGKEEKKYYVFRRGCGDIEIKEKENEKKLEKLSNGVRIKFRLSGSRSCDIKGWKVF